MKNLFEFIQESLLINEESESNTSLWTSKTREASDIRYKMKEFFKTSQDSLKPNNQGKKKSMENQTDLRTVYKGMINYCKMGETEEQFRAKLRKYGLSSEEGFKKFIMGCGHEFEENKWNMNWCLQYDLNAMEAEYKRAKEAGEIPDSIDDEEAEERDLVIYDRWNPETHMIKPFKGKRGKSTDHEVNNIRMDFHYEYGVEYYDCYPILWKNYDGRVEELKRRATEQIGYEDPNEFK